MRRLLHSNVARLTALAAFFALAGWVIASVTAHDAAQTVEKASFARSVDTCRRANPSRAYLLLRAQEFTRTSALKRSYTTAISPLAFAILNCAATVRNHGRPVPLPLPVQQEYLRLFRRRLVPLTREDRIVGTVPFAVYFSPRQPAAP